MESLDKKEADCYLNTLIDEALKGSAEYTAIGKAVALDLRDLLIKESDLSISRAPDIAGSMGKQSHLGPAYKPDFDVVLYINVCDLKKKYGGKFEKIPNSELEKVIDDTIKTITEVVQRRANNDPVNKVCVDVTYKGYDFDLVPAINFQEGDNGAMNAQWTAVLNRCAEEGADLPFLGPSMSDMVVEYIHGRKCVTEAERKFCRRVIMLCKMWKHHMKIFFQFKHGLKIVDKMCAESTIVELVGMKAAQFEWKNGVGSVTKAFETFLLIMATDREKVKVILDTRGVAFPCNVDKQLKANEARTGGILIDPVNPYLNYLDPGKYDVVEGWKVLQWAAKTSLSILRRGCYCGCGSLERRLQHAVGIKLARSGVAMSETLY